MRFMMIVKANPDTEAGVLPTSDELAVVGRYNEDLIKAGVLLAAEGLHASSKGKRLKLEGGRLKVTDGPFTESKELIAGFWIIDVKDEDEALAWARRVPFEACGEIELRKVFETSDFPVDPVTEEHLRKEQEFRDATQRPVTA